MTVKQKSNPEQLKQILSVVSQFGALVTGVTLLIQLFVDDAPGLFYQQTLSAIIVFAFATMLWLWRWPKITEKRRQRNSRDNNTSTVEGLIKPFNDPGGRSYVLSLVRRRFEGALLLLISIAAVISITGKAKGIAEELSGLKCSYAGERDAPLLVISRINDLTGGNSAFENRLYTRMVDEFNDQISVCLGRRIIATGPDAEDFGKSLRRNQSVTFVIWGDSDDRLMVIHVAPIEWDAFKLVIEADTVDAGEIKGWAQDYMPQLVLGWMKFIEGNNRSSILIFDTTIRKLESEPWAGNNQEALSKLYYLLAQVYESDAQPEAAIIAYSKVLENDPEFNDARLSRGILYMEVDREKALSDFDYLIDHEAANAAYAYLYRAELQTVWASKKSDLLNVIALEPGDPYNYHTLGINALYAGDFETALSAYNDARAFVDDATRAYIVEDLQKAAEEDDSLAEIVKQIIVKLDEP